MAVDRENDLSNRTIKANQQSVHPDGSYVLVVLNRALRGEDNPVIDAARTHASRLNIDVVVYSELDETKSYASERLSYFVLGAYREVAIALAKKNIRCVQIIKKVGDKDVLRSLALKAAAIYTDEDYTHWDRAKIQRILNGQSARTPPSSRSKWWLGRRYKAKPSRYILGFQYIS